MVNENFFEKIKHYECKLNEISKLEGLDNLNISFDRLNSENQVEQELIYFSCDESCNCNEKERKGLFVFSQNYFFKELNDQEFKNILGQNMLNLLIKQAFNKVKKGNTAQISDIIENIMLNNEDLKFVSRNKVLKRILTLAYYHNWNLEKNKDDIDSNYSISIPDDFGERLKQRFNLDIAIPILDNSKYRFFVNAKGDLCLVLKGTQIFDKKDLSSAFNMIKKEFEIKNINILE